MVNPIQSQSPSNRETPSYRTKPDENTRDDSFRKKMDDRHPPTKDEQEQQGVEENENKPASLFDLSKKGTQPKGPKKSSPFNADTDALQQATSKKAPIKQKQEPIHQPVEEFTGSDNELPQDLLPKEKVPLNPKDQTQFSEAFSKSDMAKENVLLEAKKFKDPGEISSKKEPKAKESKAEGAVPQGKVEGAVTANPVQAVDFRTDKAQDVKETAAPNPIQDLVMEMVERIQTMEKNGETHTEVTLRNPPILEGATLTLTNTDNAKREFNIAFANLSPDAQAFLEHHLQKNSLKEALEQQKIVVHMITTTQGDNPRMTAAESQASQDQQQRGQGEGQQQQGQQQQRQRRPSENEEENAF